MSDVPEDIRKQAVYYVGMMFAGVTLGKDIDRAAKIIEDARGFFVEAILSERLAQKERDAKTAEETGKAYCRDHFVMMGPAGIAHKVAHAIRSAALSPASEGA